VRARATLLPLALTIASLSAGLGCASTDERPRVETFRVDEGRRAFSLEVEEPGRPLVRYEGDEAGLALALTVGGRALPKAEAQARRGELTALLDRAIARCEGLPEAALDVSWMRRFREAYARRRLR